METKNNIIIVLLIIATITTSILVINKLTHYNYDYVTTIQVNKPEKIEQAISNCIIDVQSRNFKIIRMDVRRYKEDDIVIECGGVTEDHLIK